MIAWLGKWFPGLDWIALLKLGLQILLSVSDVVREKQLLEAGESVAVAKSMAELSRRLGIMEEIKAETEKMSDEDLIKDAMEN